MMAVAALTIYRFRPTGAPVAVAPPPARQAAADGAAAPPPPASGLSPPASVLPPYEPPSPEDRGAFDKDAQALLDVSTSIDPTEMPAYSRLLEWAKLLPTSDARGKSVRFHDLISKPSEHRGELLHLRLAIRRVLSYDLPADDGNPPQKVYELWGWPEAADGWLYVVVTQQLPAGFPETPEVAATADVEGYFLKLQGYYPATAKPGARPLAAPLVVGTVRWTPPPVAVPQPIISWFGLAIVGVTSLILMGYWIWPRKEPVPSLAPLPDIRDPFVPPLDKESVPDEQFDEAEEDTAWQPQQPGSKWDSESTNDSERLWE